MTQSDKLKQLIETIKVSNEVMKRQLDLNGRTLDLLGSLIIEPESLPIEIPTHGANDARYIASLTDIQLKKLIDIQL